MKNLLKFSSIFILGTVATFSQQTVKEKMISELKSKPGIKVEEIQKDMWKIEYPNGNIKMKTTAEYNSNEFIPSNPNFDSTIIDLRNIDTTAYYKQFSYWTELKIGSLDELPLIGDINGNNRPEIYGFQKDYNQPYEEVTYVYELNREGKFDSVFKYENTAIRIKIYDIDKNNSKELYLCRNYYYQDSTGFHNWRQYLFYEKPEDTSLATSLKMIFEPFKNGDSQLNKNEFGDWDGDSYTDQIFVRFCCPPSFQIYEYNAINNNFDSVYIFDYSSLGLVYDGFSIGDFDQDGKTEFFSGSIHGKVITLENNGDNTYGDIWQSSVETYNAFLHTSTNDLDGNGKEEIWVGGDAFYNGFPKTRITLFETSGNNNYQPVGRIDLLGAFSWTAGNMQAVDLDKDGKDEIMLCIDGNILIFKFAGSEGHQLYNLFYLKKNTFSGSFISATLYDLDNDTKEDLIVNLEGYQNQDYRYYSFILKADFPVEVKTEVNPVPVQFLLYNNYPNPFNSSTVMSYSVPSVSNVTIKIFNTLGQEIRTILNEEKLPGKYQINFNAENLPSGVYFYQLRAGSLVQTKKMILLR